MLNCKICNSSTIFLFGAIILHKFHAEYYRCTNCEFVFIKDPIWLEEAYTKAISDYDTGILIRNEKFSDKLSHILKKNYNKNATYLDFGGGYGIFVRMMRDRGYNFFWYDQFCENLFAKEYDFDIKTGGHFELISAIEVFEHLPNPLNTLDELFMLTDDLFFTTELVPNNNNLTNINDWHYFAPDYGQHIGFYTIKTLETIALKLNKYFYSDKKQVHLFSSKKFKSNPVKSNKVYNYIRKRIYFTFKGYSN
jgi:hypothetical protein